MSELRVNSLFGPDESAAIQLVDEGLEVLQQALTVERPSTFEVEAGSYLLRAFWSDGRKTQQVVLVPAEGTSLELEAPTTGRPPDLGWTNPAAPEQIVKMAIRDSDLSEEAAWRPPASRLAGMGSDDWSVAETIERRLRESGLTLQGPDVPAAQMWHRMAGGTWETRPLDADLEEVAGGFDLHLAVEDSLHLLEIRSGTARQYLSLPSERSIVSIRWFRWQSEVYSSAAVRTADDDVEALRGHIRGGDLALARTAAPQVMAERFLRAKVAAPRIAALGAYFLLRVGDFERLHDWPDNLTNWKPWLPDGSVIAAWQRLRSDNPDYAEAYNLLMEAMQRGLPVYSEGVRLLRQGLELFANDDEQDWEVAGALAELDRYGRAMDWSRSETSYFGDAPDQPRLGARLSWTTRKLYETVYEVTTREARNPSSPAIETHKRFALALPPPAAVSEEDAAALCSLVVVAGEWGLEGFYFARETSTGLPLGELVRRELPAYAEHQGRARELAELYRPDTLQA